MPRTAFGILPGWATWPRFMPRTACEFPRAWFCGSVPGKRAFTMLHEPIVSAFVQSFRKITQREAVVNCGCIVKNQEIAFNFHYFSFLPDVFIPHCGIR